MITHFCILAWEIPWTGSLPGCSPWDCRVRHDSAIQQQQHVPSTAENFQGAKRIEVEHSCNKEALRLSLSLHLIRQEGKGKEEEDKEKVKLHERDRQREEGWAAESSREHSQEQKQAPNESLGLSHRPHPHQTIYLEEAWDTIAMLSLTGDLGVEKACHYRLWVIFNVL